MCHYKGRRQKRAEREKEAFSSAQDRRSPHLGTERKKTKQTTLMENTLPYAHGHFPPSFSTRSWSLLSGINRSGWEKQGKLSSGGFCPRAVPGLEVILDLVV